MRRAAKVAAALAACALALLASAGAAAAHADLLATDPADGSRVDVAPEAVTLTFTESVTVPSGGISVVAASGEPVPAGEPATDGAVVSVPLDPLADGTYVVSWRVVSSDSHPVRGAFTFTVGDGPAADPAAVADLLPGPSDRPWEVAGAVARTLAYAGALVAAGGGLYLAVVDPGAPRRLYRLVQVAAHVGTVGLLAVLPARAALVSGRGPSSLFDGAVAADVLAEGVGLSVTVTLLGLAVVLVGLVVIGTAGRILLVAGGLAAVAGFAATGHTTETDPEWLATGSDVVHAAAGAAWLGGLACLGLAFGRRRGVRPETGAAGAATVVGRFSTVAGVSIAGVGVAGVALAWSQVRSIDALVSTTYGRLLLAKVAVVAAVAAVGAYNHYRLVPAVQRDGDAGGWDRLRRTVRLESGALVLAVAITAVLVEVTPARTAVERAAAVATADLGDVEVEVVVDEPVVGRAAVDLTLTGPGGDRLVLDDDAVTVELQHPGAGIGPISRQPTPVAPGRWRLDGGDLTVAGTWELTVQVRVDRFEQRSATVTVGIAGP